MKIICSPPLVCEEILKIDFSRIITKKLVSGCRFDFYCFAIRSRIGRKSKAKHYESWMNHTPVNVISWQTYFHNLWSQKAPENNHYEWARERKAGEKFIGRTRTASFAVACKFYVNHWPKKKSLWHWSIKLSDKDRLRWPASGFPVG